jgi:hypothetical protein
VDEGDDVLVWRDRDRDASGQAGRRGKACAGRENASPGGWFEGAACAGRVKVSRGRGTLRQAGNCWRRGTIPRLSRSWGVAGRRNRAICAERVEIEWSVRRRRP